jgi:putative endonuclease
MAAKDELGQRGERLAERALVGRGYEILDRNWRCAAGEIDLIARDGDELVFVEVKTRRSTTYGHPFEAITAAKLARLRRLVAAWLAAGGSAHLRAGRVRIDAIAVLAPADAPASLEHLEGIF